MTAVDLAVVLGFQVAGLLILYSVITHQVNRSLREVVLAVSKLNQAMQVLHAQHGKILPFRRK